MSFLDLSGVARFLENLKSKFVMVDAQTLTAAQQKQARLNIGVTDTGAPEVYIGSGEMPTGYVLQIDPEGETGFYSKDETDALLAAKEAEISDLKDSTYTKEEVDALLAAYLKQATYQGDINDAMEALKG
jgi:hypothetical protein